MSEKRACAILVADGNMAAAFRGFFGRNAWHLSLGCAAVDIRTDVGGDLLVDASGNDPGVYTKAHELLRPYQATHRHALVVLDCAWDGSPGRKAIIRNITNRLVKSGWPEDAVKVIAIEPELENWLWQDKPQVAEALRYRGTVPLRQYLEQNNKWPAGLLKPPQPKEVVEWLLGRNRLPRSSAIYQKLASTVSVKGCVDQAFKDMLEALQNWFPEEVES